MTWANIVDEHLGLCKYTVSKYVYCYEASLKHNEAEYCHKGSFRNIFPPQGLEYGQLNHLRVEVIEYHVVMSTELSTHSKTQIYWKSKS